MRHGFLVVVGAALTLGLCACDNVNRSLIFFTNTTAGLDVGVDPSSSTGRIMLGYKRQEGVINPVYQPPPTSKVVKETGTVPAKHSHKTATWERETTYGKEWRPAEDVYRDEAYSVIAKIVGEGKGKAGQGAGSAEASAAMAQWFATGQAAIELAKNPATAGAVVGSSEIAKAAVGAELPKAFAGKLDIARFAQLRQVHDDMAIRVASEPAANRLMEHLDVESNRVLANLKPFVLLERRGSNYTHTANGVSAAADGGFGGLLSFISSVDTGLANLRGINRDRRSASLDDRPASEQGATLQGFADQLLERHKEAEAALKDPGVVSSFVELAEEWVKDYQFGEGATD